MVRTYVRLHNIKQRTTMTKLATAVVQQVFPITQKPRFFWAQFHVLFTFKEKTKCLWYLPLTCSLGEDYLGGDQKVKMCGEKSFAVSKSCYFHSN